MSALLVLPVLLAMWASGQLADPAPDAPLLVRRPWSFFVLLAFSQARSFVGWMLGVTHRWYRIGPARGGPPLSATRVVRRLASLGEACVPIGLRHVALGRRWTVKLHFGSDSPPAQRVLLDIEPARRRRAER